MISQYERFAFIGETRVYTSRNLFKNDIPTALDLFGALEKLWASGKKHSLARPPRVLTLVDFRISNSRYAEMLFRIIDPSIPDNVLSDRTNGALRTAARKQTEDPAVSAHMCVDLDPKFDQTKAYPTAIENIDFLPRSLIIHYINDWAKAALSEERARPEKKDKKIFCPRIEFIAPHSQTIADAFDNGGVLTGVKWVEDRMEQKTFGDQAYPVEQRTDISIKVKNRPTGAAAKDLLKQAWSKAFGKKPERFKVTIEDGNHRLKTVGIDPSKNNVLSNLFIPQVLLSNFSTPMAMCEANIRNDLLAKMKKEMK